MLFQLFSDTVASPQKSLLMFTSRISHPGENFPTHLQRAEARQKQRHCLVMLTPPSHPHLYLQILLKGFILRMLFCATDTFFLLAGVVNNLQTGGFFNDKVTKSCLFATVHDAVLHCQTSGTPSQHEVTNKTTVFTWAAAAWIVCMVELHPRVRFPKVFITWSLNPRGC